MSLEWFNASDSIWTADQWIKKWWRNACHQKEWMVGGGKRKKHGRGGGRLLHSHFCGSPSSWVGVLWTPSLRMSRSEMASQASWLPPSPLALCPWQSWRERENKHTFHFTSKVHQYIHEQSMNYISLQEVLTRALVHVKMYWLLSTTYQGVPVVESTWVSASQ